MNGKNNNLSPEKQAELETLKIHFAFLNSLLTQRTAIVPTIASLSAMILVVATFNEKLLPLTEDIKIALVILLALIPISILFSIFEIHSAIETATEAINKITRGKEPFASKNWFGKICTILITHTPLFLGVVLSLIIVWIILVILGF